MTTKKKVSVKNSIKIVITGEIEVVDVEGLSIATESIRNAVEELRQYGNAGAKVSGQLVFDAAKEFDL